MTTETTSGSSDADDHARVTAMPIWPAWAVLILVAGGMLWWCWGRCPDVLTDYGREVYVPWRLSQGDVLYTDVAHFNGPLSQYFNAWLFRICGPSIACLAWANVVIFAVLVWLVASIVTAMSNRWVAYSCCLLLVLVFGFGHLDPNGNFNYIYPYSHEATHGLVLALGAIWCYSKFLKRHQLVWAVATGALFGLTLLTKPEAFLALTAALIVALIATGLAGRRASGRGRWAMGMLAGAVTPPLVCWLLLVQWMPPSMALRGTLGGWVYLTNSELTSQVFYRSIRGTTRLGANLEEIGIWTLIYLAIYVPALFFALRVKAQGTAAQFAAALVFAVTGAVAWWFFVPVFSSAVAPLPVFLAAALMVRGVRLARQPAEEVRQRTILELTMLTFSLALLFKMILDVNITVYGFTLAMPGVLMLMVVMLDWIPATIRARDGSPAVFQAAWLGPLSVFVGTCLYVDSLTFPHKAVPIGSGGDRILAYASVAQPVNEILTQLDELATPGQTVASVPEGVMINYLARRANSTPYINFYPPELIMFGEEPMLSAFTAHPPDFLIWIPSSARVYGYAAFGDGYAERLAKWIVTNYEPVGAGGNDGNLRLVLMRHVGPH